MGAVNAVTSSIIDLVRMVLNLYMWVIIISALLTWVNPDPYNPIVRFLRAVTEPVFMRVRRWMPFVMIGGMDLSPLVVIFAIYFVQMLLLRLTAPILMGG